MRKFQFGFYDSIDYSKELKIDPRVVMNQQGVDEIINQVLEGADSKDIENQELLTQLLAVDALMQKDKLQIAFPLFLVDDFDKIQQALKPTITEIIRIIEGHRETIYQGLSHLDPRFPPQHHAYFAICAGLLDGIIFDEFERKNIVTTSKIHNNGLNYLIIGSEKHPKIIENSVDLLCSWNRCGHFVSFGTSLGARLDVYRARQRISAGNITPQFASIAAICQEALWEPRSLGDRLSEAIEDMRQGLAVEPYAGQLLEIFNYVKDSEIIVPVYDNIREAIALISEPFIHKIVSAYGDFVQNMDEVLSGTQLIKFSCTREDIANEVWHLVFGEVNEELVRRGFVKKPVAHSGQGRYLKCLEFND